MTLLERALGRAVGVLVHGAAVVEFDGFRELVDALGGVEVSPPHHIDDDFVGEDGRRFSAHFRVGRQTLDGEQALTYARTRKADGEGWRRSRHVELLLALLGRARATRSPGGLLRALTAARRAVATDLGPLRILALLQALARLSPQRIRTSQLEPPLVRSVRDPQGRWIHVGDPQVISGFVLEELGLAPSPPSR